ncbi:SulP family inorganic anion transporter [Paraburkholderia sp. Cpub6]|uniref:SulP family inorganic anion transporter n=1 Tax=Paraburkholderia sp. Cpub6 TaxID=2723094 RepID=UPI00161F9C62|nr:SulP family inorganic anion transporter [Paraburkholderia sp. Cpub6]MBB5460293.1 high affinity sulfate transporter 1 [Paraburkholderia sp. Cpub6]
MKSTVPTDTRLPRLPLLRGLLPLNRAALPHDIVAGITLAALGIPEVMGYTKIAGTPAVTGLYTILLPLVAFAVLGGSRHLVAAADSATAAILAGTLVAVAALGSPEYVSLTSTVALAVAAMLVLARIFRLGFLADFLSRSALIGFLTGVGIQVAAGELAGLAGLSKEGHGPLAQIASVFQRLGDMQYATLALSVAVLVVIAGCKRIAPRIPGALIAVVGAIAASSVFNFAQHGIAVIGNVPSGLPSLSLPAFHLADIDVVLTTAASCFIVILAQSIATARAYANRYNERVDANLDIVGLAGANLAAALTGTFVVNGSPTKTEMVDDAGGRSQVAHLTTAAIVLLVLLFLTKPLSFMPAAVLSAIVFLIGVKLVDLKGMSELYRLQKDEFVLALITAGVVVFVDVKHGILIAVLLSLIDHARHSYRLRTRVLTRDAGGQWQAHPVAPNVFAVPGVVVYRFEADVFYANASRFMEEILKLVEGAQSPVRWVVVDASEVHNIDFTAGKMLLQLRDELLRRGIGIASVAVAEGVRVELERYRGSGGPDAARQEIFPTVDAVVDALRDAPPPPPVTGDKSA